jgi:hypothetical protein
MEIEFIMAIFGFIGILWILLIPVLEWFNPNEDARLKPMAKWEEENMTNKERVAKWREEQKKGD